MGSILRVEQLNYKDIIKDISFSLEEGTFNVLIGSNSCGKSTLVKCLSGLLKYEGFVYLNNILQVDITSEVGFVINSIFFTEKSVLSNLLFPLINLGYTEINAKKKIYSLLDKLGIEHIVSKNVEDLNNSEKKILFFACSIIHEPKIIIIDDIFDDISICLKEKIFKYLKKLNKENHCTIFLLTNNEEYIMIANNVIIMGAGKIIESNSLENILKKEKIFVKNNIKLPFIVDLSNKLQFYGLLDNLTLDYNEMVKKIWE